MGEANQPRDLLLAEDSPSDAEIFRVAFRKHTHRPYRLHVVPDGEATLAFLRQEGGYAGMPRPQLLLLDIVLPKLDGWRVLETIRATPALATLPVVMLTGVMTKQDEERGATLQPLAFFEKSLHLDAYPHLVAELEQLLDALPDNG